MIDHEIKQHLDTFAAAIRDGETTLRRARVEIETAVERAKQELAAAAAVAVARVRAAWEAPDALLPTGIRRAMTAAAASALEVALGPGGAAIRAGERDLSPLFFLASQPLVDALDQVPPHLQLAATRACLADAVTRILQLQVVAADADRAKGPAAPESDGAGGPPTAAS